MTTLPPISGDLRIPYPAHDTEFEVQAWLYNELRRMGFETRGEIKAPYSKKSKGQKARFCRFDIVVYNKQLPVVILEVKAATVRHKTCVTDTRQGTRYPHFGVPVMFVYGMPMAQKLIGDWPRIWPELVSQEGAPAIPEAEQGA